MLLQGVHSTPDLVGAALLSKLVLHVYMPFNEHVHQWVEYSTEAMYVPFIVALVVLCCYPRPKVWAVSFGDTAIVSGVTAGVILGRNLYGRCQQELGRCDAAVLVHLSGAPGELVLDSVWFLKQTVARFLVGAVMVAASYYIVKPIVSMVMVTMLSHSHQPPNRRYAVEGPTKFFSYGAIGFTVVTACPLVYRWMGLDAT